MHQAYEQKEIAELDWIQFTPNQVDVMTKINPSILLKKLMDKNAVDLSPKFKVEQRKLKGKSTGQNFTQCRNQKASRVSD